METSQEIIGTHKQEIRTEWCYTYSRIISHFIEQRRFILNGCAEMLFKSRTRPLTFHPVAAVLHRDVPSQHKTFAN
jgi:hypothetical protein